MSSTKISNLSYYYTLMNNNIRLQLTLAYTRNSKMCRAADDRMFAYNNNNIVVPVSRFPHTS